MKLLFIDDEYNVTLGLQRIIDWKHYGFAVLGTAANGPEGLHKILTKNPDIVLIDIRMPGMSGLEVIQHAREQHFEGEFILLTAYQDFDYARAGIKYGVVDYLLKPVDEEELLRAVLNAEKRLLANNVINMYGDQNLSLVRSNLFENALLGRISQIGMRLGLQSNEVIKALVVVGNQSFFSAIELVLLKILGTNCIHCVQTDRMVILLVGRSAISAQSMLMQSIAQLDSGMVFYEGGVLHSAEEIPADYRRITALMERIWFYRREGTVQYSTELLNTSSDAALLKWSEQAISDSFIQAIEDQDAELIRALIEKLRMHILCRRMTVDEAKVFLLSLFRSISKHISLRFPDYYLQSQYYPEQITVIGSMQNALDLIGQLCMQVLDNMDRNSNQGVCQLLLQYIDQNYTQQLRLQDLAKKFGYDSAYLGKLLKQKTGHSFNTYLDNIRLERACELLRTGQPIASIALQCGFSSVEYFSQKFRKTLGCSPRQYRGQLKE